jgi:hypothetical protein
LPEYPRGALIRYREWYNSNSQPNVGLRMMAEEVADGIRHRERGDLGGDRYFSGVADPSIFAEDGGPSIAMRMSERGVHWTKADNKRTPGAGAMGGWDAVRARLIGEDSRPMVYFFSTCRDLIRTLPALQHDPDRLEDVDTHMEDHACDELRYACLSRPFVVERPLSDAEARDAYRRHYSARDRSILRGRGGSAMGSVTMPGL